MKVLGFVVSDKTFTVGVLNIFYDHVFNRINPVLFGYISDRPYR